MRRGRLITIMVVLVGAVVAVSVATLRRGSNRVLHEFRAAQSRLAEDASSGLSGYLDSFDRDTRLMADLARRTRGQSIGERGQDQVILASFESLATVVRHYRTIALLGPDQPPIVAIDPTEDRSDIAPKLIAASADLARDASVARSTLLRGPVTVAPGRSFYFYAAPVGEHEAVVVTSDAAMMLEVVWRGRAGRQHLVVVDPSGAIWLGCEDRHRCRLLPVGHDAGLGTILNASDPGEPARPFAGAASLGLPERLVVGRAAPLTTRLGPWSVALLASAADINARERALLWQLVLTAAGVIGVMLLAGTFIVRQQATAAGLTARLQAAEEVATLRERSEKILDNVPVGIIGVTRDARVAMMNRFFGISLARGDVAGWLWHLQAHLQRALATGRTQTVNDVELGSTPSNLHDYDVRVVPLSRPANEIEALVLLEDVSELRNLQRQLVRAEKLVTVGVLSAGIAHEVGTPLSVIRGRAEHLLERTADGAIAEDLRAIVAQIDRISSIIRQVLEFSRTRAPQVGPADARAGVAKALELLEWRIAKRSLTVKIEASEPIPAIAADAQQFEQVLVNLIMNACDASAAGGAIEIVLGPGTDLSGPVPRLRIQVIDHGTGIAAADLNAVFDPYFTTKKRGEGTGLGLAIVARVVRSHHGEVSLASTVNVGTTMTILWPIAPAGSPDEAGAHA